MDAMQYMLPRSRWDVLYVGLHLLPYNVLVLHTSFDGTLDLTAGVVFLIFIKYVYEVQ